MLESIKEKYSRLNEFIIENKLCDLDKVKPLLSYKDIQSLYGMRPDPIMKRLKSEQVKFQILNPDADISAVKQMALEVKEQLLQELAESKK